MFKLLKFLKPFIVPITIVCVLLFIQAISQLYLPTLMADIVDKGIVNGDTALILSVGGVMLLVALVGAVCTIVAGYISAKVSASFGMNMRARVFERVENFTLHEFDQVGTASLITRTTNDITQVQQVVLMGMRMLVTTPMMVIGGVIMALSRDVKLSGVLLVVLPVLGVTVAVVASKGLPLFKAMQTQLDKLNLVLREGLTGIRVVRAFNRIDHEQKRFAKANYDLTNTAIRVNKIMATVMPVIMFMLNVTTLALVWFGGIRIDQGSMQVGDLMAFIQYAMQIMFSLLTVSMMFIMLPRASVSAVRVNEVLEMQPSVKDADKVMDLIPSRGYVEFKNVTFSYPGAEQPALRDISFRAGPGEVTAIIGGTGAGKSTLVKLIQRFYDVDSGAIEVGGVDVRYASQQSLRAKIGYLPQKTVLFTGTVAENIRYGREDATEGEILASAQTAQAEEFVSAMTEGFAATVSQGGTNLSGGQKQRLSISRALVRRPEIYLFDDSFSALDFKTDARLRAALKKETVDATVLVVAQRVSSVMDADRIIVLEDGKVVGLGTHRELAKTCVVYREIIASQLSEEELA